MGEVVILGCGPAGLLAAHAAELAGHKPRIISRNEPSVIAGAMYLHRYIPGLVEQTPHDYIHIAKLGTPEGYAQKVYGDPQHPVSFNQFDSGTFPMWFLDRAYRYLWEKYEYSIHNVELDASKMPVLLHNHSASPIICTIPKRVLCRQPMKHAFIGQRIVIRQTARRGPWMHNRMVYNGDLDDLWYRYSAIGDKVAEEFSLLNGYPPDFDPSKEDWFMGVKPIRNSCDCWPEVHFMGRFGSWTKGELTHHAFEQAAKLLHLEVPSAV